MSDEEMDAELRRCFVSSSKASLDAPVLAELRSICRLHSLDAQEAFFKWEAYSFKMEGTSLNLETVRALKKDIQEQLDKDGSKNSARAPKKQRMQVTATPRNTAGGVDMLGSLLNNTPTPAAAKRQIPNSTPSRPPQTPKTPADGETPTRSTDTNGLKSLPFAERSNPGQVVESLNSHLELPPPPEIPFLEPRIKLTANTDSSKFSYRPMAMHLSEASEVLDDRIDEFAEYVQAKHNLQDIDFGSPASQSTHEIVAVGRICSDSLDGKLNSASIVLESSRRMGAGLRTPLKVDELSSYEFFPGQIVALRGINASGEYFVAKEILELPLLPAAASTPAQLDAHVERLQGGPDLMQDDIAPMSILIASGPYTTDDSLDFEALRALCDEAAKINADGLVLMGPFLDIGHPALASGDFELPDDADVSPDSTGVSAIFKALVAPPLKRLADQVPGITIMMVPSVRDMLSNHVSWPQEPLGAVGGSIRRDLGLPKQVKLALSNPMMLSLNEVMFGMSTQDILWELKKQETTKAPSEINALSRLSKHMIQQRHFFPLFPPEPPGQGYGQNSTGASLDTAYLKLGELLNVRPDVLITPSALSPFVKVVESVIAINPGTLSKKKGAGTYCKLVISPRTVSDEERSSGGPVGHQVYDRARADIVRI